MLKMPAHPGWLFVLQIVTVCGLFVLIAHCYSNVLRAKWQATAAMMGMLTGTRDWERFQKVLLFSLGFALALSVALTGVCYLFTEQIVRAFLTEPAAFDYGFTFSRILLSTSVLFGVYYVLTNTLQAMGAATPSLIINLSRQGLIYIPALFLLKALLGITGLTWAQPVADVLSLLLAVVLYVPRYRKMVRGQ